jgi:hypothetical protein
MRFKCETEAGIVICMHPHRTRRRSVPVLTLLNRRCGGFVDYYCACQQSSPKAITSDFSFWGLTVRIACNWCSIGASQPLFRFQRCKRTITSVP